VLLENQEGALREDSRTIVHRIHICIAKMLSRQSLATETGVPYQNIQCGILGGLTGPATCFSPRTLALPCHPSANGGYSCVYRQHYTIVTLVTVVK